MMTAINPINTAKLSNWLWNPVINIETGFKRKAADKKDRIESAGDDFFEKVRTGYLEIAKDHDYIKVVDADDDPEVIHQKIISLVEEINHD